MYVLAPRDERTADTVACDTLPRLYRRATPSGCLCAAFESRAASRDSVPRGCVLERSMVHAFTSAAAGVPASSAAPRGARVR